MTIERMDILQDIIQDLKGTCQILEDVAEHHGIAELTLDDLRFIEEDIFLCSSCGWWCETCECNEVDDDRLCDDCV